MSLILPGDSKDWQSTYARYDALTKKVNIFKTTLEDEVLSALATDKRSLAKSLVLPEAGLSEFSFRFSRDNLINEPMIHTSMVFPDHHENFIGNRIATTKAQDIWAVHTDVIRHPEEQDLPKTKASRRLKAGNYPGVLSTIDALTNYFLVKTMPFINLSNSDASIN